MNKYPSTVTATHLLRGAFCIITAISLASAGVILGQTKNARPDQVNDLGNVNLSLVAPAPDGPGAGLVTNGGFETGDFTGWTQSGNTGFTGVAGGGVEHSGMFGAFFGPTGSNGFITQDLTTTTGALYDLSFWLKNTGGTPNHFEVSWNGGILNSIDDGAATPYTQYSYPGLAATTTSTPLQFGFRDDPSFWELDDISVTLHIVREAPDFNGDNFPDLVLFNSSSTRRSAIWFLNDNTFTGSTFGPTIPAGWNVIDAADFDGDGNVDYALFNAGTRHTAIWYFVGTSFSSSVFGPTLPSGWALISTGEFNGDASPDFVLFNATTRRTAIWFLNNHIFTGSALGPTVPSGWRGVGGGDFNGDGRLDYAFFNLTTRQTAIWYLMGSTFVSSALGPTAPPGWELIGVADFNRDGAPDFVLFNASTRKTAIWHLNNNSFMSSAFGPTTPAGWDIVVP